MRLLRSAVSNELTALIENDQTRHANIAWYNTHPDYIKKLIRLHAQDILNGKMIPTQLRKYVPGIRNAGEERVYNLETNQLIYQGYHAANPGHVIGKDEVNQTATNQSIQQLDRLTGGQHLHIHTLVSPINPASDDPNLYKQVTKATAGNQKITYSNTSFNPARYIKGGSSFNIREADKICEIAEGYTQNQPAEKDALVAKLNICIQEYKTQRELWRNKGETPNVFLVSALKNMASLVNQIAGKTIIVQIDPCVSGKDRQGVARMAAVNDAILLDMTDSLAREANAKTAKNIRVAMVNSGQVKLQAGHTNGGSIGAAGIKKDSKSALPTSWKDDGIYIEKTAKYNKTFPKKPADKPFYKKAKFWIGIVGLVAAALLCATGIGAFAGVPLATAIISTAASGVSVALTAIAGLFGAGAVAASATAITATAISAGVAIAAVSAKTEWNVKKEQSVYKGRKAAKAEPYANPSIANVSPASSTDVSEHSILDTQSDASNTSPNPSPTHHGGSTDDMLKAGITNQAALKEQKQGISSLAVTGNQGMLSPIPEVTSPTSGKQPQLESDNQQGSNASNKRRSSLS